VLAFKWRKCVIYTELYGNQAYVSFIQIEKLRDGRGENDDLDEGRMKEVTAIPPLFN